MTGGGYSCCRITNPFQSTLCSTVPVDSVHLRKFLKKSHFKFFPLTISLLLETFEVFSFFFFFTATSYIILNCQTALMELSKAVVNRQINSNANILFIIYVLYIWKKTMSR